MFGHDYVTDERELVFLAHAVEDFRQQVACTGISQEGKPPVATASNKMQVTLAATSLEFVTRGDGVYAAHPLPKPQRVRHPKKKSQKPRSTATTTTVVVSSVRMRVKGGKKLDTLSKGCATRPIIGAGIDFFNGHPNAGKNDPKCSNCGPKK